MHLMNDAKIPVNRNLVGILAIACLVSALVIFLKYPGNESWQLWQAGFTRVGLVMCAFWLALPSRYQQAAWANLSATTGLP